MNHTSELARQTIAQQAKRTPTQSAEVLQSAVHNPEAMPKVFENNKAISSSVKHKASRKKFVGQLAQGL
jgi:hypothetical protein